LALLLLKHIRDPDLDRKLPEIFALLRTLMEKETGMQWLEVYKEAIELGITLKFPGDLDVVMNQVNEIDDLDTLREIKETIKTAKDISEILALLK
jgi:hypothetical protein